MAVAAAGIAKTRENRMNNQVKREVRLRERRRSKIDETTTSNDEQLRATTSNN